LVGLAVIFPNKQLLVLLSEKLLVELGRLERVPLYRSGNDQSYYWLHLSINQNAFGTFVQEEDN
jgi:hypothetical protein